MLALCCGQYLGNVSFTGEANRIPVSIAHAEEAVHIAREVGWRSAEALAFTVLGQALSAGGEYARALEAMQTGLAVAAEIEHQQWQLNAHLNLGALHLDLLDLATARTHLETSLSIAEAIGSLYWRRTVAGFLASAHVQAGALDGAASLLASVLPSGTPAVTMGERHSWTAKAELALAQKDPAQALWVLDMLSQAAPESDGDARVSIPRLALLRGEALAALDRLAEAEAVLTAGGESARRQGTRNWAWRTHAALARLYRLGGRMENAEWETAAGRALVEALAASLPGEAHRALRENFVQGALAAFPPTPTLTPRQKTKKAFGGLTSRERQVAARVAQGRTNRAIADEFVVSERTIEKHIENILSKLGFTARAQIAAWAVEKGLKEPGNEGTEGNRFP
jgi:non-specific serine/threonine protein kinase